MDAYFEVSAKSGHGLDTIMPFVIDKLLTKVPSVVPGLMKTEIPPPSGLNRTDLDNVISSRACWELATTCQCNVL